MKCIKLTQGKSTVVSAIDYTYLNQWKWYVIKDHKTYYAVRHAATDYKRIYMHRVILERMGFKKFELSDHRDRDGLNNQRRNLRPANYAENNRNSRRRVNNTSGYTGVYWQKQNKKWAVQIQVAGKHRHLGLFTNRIKAAKTYNRAARKFYGKFAKLNKVQNERQT